MVGHSLTEASNQVTVCFDMFTKSCGFQTAEMSCGAKSWSPPIACRLEMLQRDTAKHICKLHPWTFQAANPEGLCISYHSYHVLGNI